MRSLRTRNYNSLNSVKISGNNIAGKAALIIVIVLTILQIFTAIQTSSMSALLATIEHKESQLVQKTEELTGDIVSQSSLISVREMSKELGYLNPIMTLYITEKETIALQR